VAGSLVVPKPRSFTIASVNVNGLRAAIPNGMGGWWHQRRPDVVTMQEVRAPHDLVAGLVADVAGKPWHVHHHECAAKGRAGVAVATREASTGNGHALSGEFDGTGRWVEAELPTADGRGLTVISCYVHTGDADTPERMREKLAFLDAAAERLAALRTAGRHVVLTGDLNVGHREFDIKNWKGNLKKAGFLPEERTWFDRLFADGWVDVTRVHAGEVAGPYTWWSWRGKAFDIDSGWRIDYQIVSPELAATVTSVVVDRAPTYAERWSDHAPLVVAYTL